MHYPISMNDSEPLSRLTYVSISKKGFVERPPQIQREKSYSQSDQRTLSSDSNTEESKEKMNSLLQERMKAIQFVSIDFVCQAIFDKKSDEEIYSLLNRIDISQINQKNSNGQTLLYVACRAGRVEVIKKIVEIPGILLGGPQNTNQKSTPLHGANWGGHIQVIAMLLTLGAKPEENCVTPDGRGLPPSEEGNPNLPKQVLEQLRILWLEYSEKGVEPIYKYLPHGWTPISSKSIIFERKSLTEIPIVIDDSSVSSSTESFNFTNGMVQSKTTSASNSYSQLDQLLESSSTTPKTSISLPVVKTMKKQPSDNCLPSSSSPSTPSTPTKTSVTLANYETLPKYGPQYKRFPYIFYWKDGKDEIHLYDVATTSKLNKAYSRRDINTVHTVIKNKDYEIKLDTMYHTCLSDKKKKVRNVGMFPRIPQWYWRDDDGTLKLYDEKTNIEIYKRKCQGINTLRVTIGKWTYEIKLDHKIQMNIKSETERSICTEEDLANIQKWWQPGIPLDKALNKKAELVPIDRDTEEWNKVCQLFHLTMPSKTRSGVLDRASRKSGKFKDCHAVVKIEKIVNPTLREHWEHELQMVRKSNNNDPDIDYVKLLFHGTSKTPPKTIYDADKGWKISYSRDDALWGRGLYFALDSIYTHNYTHKTKEGTRKVFLAEVIVGDGIHCEEDSTLREPPLKENGKRYDSVIGQRHDTWIWITYDDARAYPTYLIEYKSN